jgi:chromosome partitioning protein
LARVIVAVFNPKGGVGKTATAVNLAAAMAQAGRRVLLVDLEADMNASISLGIRPNDLHPSIADLLLHRERPNAAVRTFPDIPNLHLISGSPILAGIDFALRHVRQPERRLADTIQPLEASFDTVLLDCPAGFSLLTISVPIAAQHLLVPIRADYLSLESLASFLRWYRDRRAARQAAASLAGILLTMVDYKRTATREIVDIIRSHNRAGVFRTEILQDPRAAEAPSHGVPLVSYGRSKAASVYSDLTRELLKRLHRRPRAR